MFRALCLSVNSDTVSQQHQPFRGRPQASPKTPKDPHSEARPPARQSASGRDCVCHVQAETQRGDALVFSLRCPPNPLIITDTHISLTSPPPPRASDAPAKPAIGLKSAKHNLAIPSSLPGPRRRLVRERRQQGENKGAGRGFASRSGSATLASSCVGEEKCLAQSASTHAVSIVLCNCTQWTLRSTQAAAVLPLHYARCLRGRWKSV